MSTEVAVSLAIVIAVAVVVLLLLLLMRRRRAEPTDELKGRFGPEYDRQVARAGDRRAAEKHMSEVARRHDRLDIRRLTEEERLSWTERWHRVQAAFVDSPSSAVGSADGTLTELMRARGYPVDDFDERADIIAVDHPEVVENYRAAHAAQQRHADSGRADTEQLRQAFVHYRLLFEALVEEPHEARSGADYAASPVTARATTRPSGHDEEEPR